MPVYACQPVTRGKILITPIRAAIYARVLTDDNAADLDRQVGEIRKFCRRRGMSVLKSVTEVGSGLAAGRPKLAALLDDPAINTLVVESRDTLAPRGSELIEAALRAAGRKLIVMDEQS